MAETKEVFVINESNGKTYWNKCGRAFQNRDGSINVKLDLFPGIQLQIREPKEKPES